MLSLPVAGFLLRDPQGEAPQHRASTPVSEAMDLIFIEGFEGETVIGINTDELTLPQPVRIDLVAGLPRSRACETDRIADTIDYGAVHAALTRLLATHQVQLLVIFFAKDRDLRLHNIEKLQHHRRHPAEKPGAKLAFQSVCNVRGLNHKFLKYGIECVLGGRKDHGCAPLLQ